MDYLNKVRIDFITKKDKIIRFIHRKLDKLYEKRQLHKKEFKSKYDSWSEKVRESTNLTEEETMLKVTICNLFLKIINDHIKSH